MRTVVIDASVALAWCFEDERADSTARLLVELESGRILVPQTWCLELANVLQLAVRKGRMQEAAATAYLDRLSQLDIEVDRETDARAWSTISVLAKRFSLTTYDAAYLELADRRRMELATLDKELIAAARGLSVRVIDLF